MAHIMFQYFYESLEMGWWLYRNGRIHGTFKGGGHKKTILLKKLLGEDIENSKVLCFPRNHLNILAKILGSSEYVKELQAKRLYLSTVKN